MMSSSSSFPRWRAAWLALALSTCVTACVANIGDAPSSRRAPVEPPTPDFNPAPGSLALLTKAQYRSSILSIVGPEIVVPTRIAPDTRALGLLTVGAGISTLSDVAVEQYENAAYDIATQAMGITAVRERLVPCTPNGIVSSECAGQFVTQFGRLAYRRPLTRYEVSRLIVIADNTSLVLQDFHQGLVYAMAAMLQSPYFLYRPMLGVEDPANPAQLEYDDYELAQRISFLIWNQTPDATLLDAAAAGGLSTDEGILEQVDRMLEDERARDGVNAFFADMLRLSDLDSMNKDPTIFVHFSPEVGSRARDETIADIEHLIFDEHGDYRDLFTIRRSFIDSRLAAIYNIPAPTLSGQGAVEFPASTFRRGLLGQVSFLGLNAHSTSTSATLRGKFVREVFLCASVPPPPANLNTSVPEVTGDTPTLRDRVRVHFEVPQCRSCHQLMDPIGLAFENFDGLGRFRTTENGAVIDASGSLNGAFYRNADELGQVMHDHPDVPKCLVRNLYRYATGHSEVTGETASLRSLSAQFVEDRYDVLQLIRRLVVDPGFRYARQPDVSPEVP